MNLTINFNNYSSGLESGIRVYKSAAPILDGALPAPVTTLPTGSTTYVDADVIRGNKYYYRFGTVLGADELITPNQAIRVVAPADTGPGPQKLACGDWDLGYFGIVKSADFVALSSLAANLGITTGTLDTDYDWFKVAYKGKVLFIARSVYRHGIPYNTLYLAGAVFGTNNNGAVTPTGAAATNQYRPQIIGAYTYIPRLLKGVADGAALPANKWQADATIPASNEYDDIMSYVCNSPKHTADTAYGKACRIDDQATPILLNNTCVDLTQQSSGFADLTKVIGRGPRVTNTNPISIAGIAQMTVSTATTAIAIFTGAPTTHGGWRPVMELVL